MLAEVSRQDSISGVLARLSERHILCRKSKLGHDGFQLSSKPLYPFLNFLKPWLTDSHSTVIIPFDERVIFVRFLDCAQFPSGHSKVAQTLDPISGI
jgi:hypothetical protein